MAYIPDKLKTEIHGLARARCEYCLIGEIFSEKPHEFDHIIATQHGGQTQRDNICLACFECNRQKGPNLCSVDPATGDVERLFDPRHQTWNDHFVQRGAFIDPISPVGRATIRVLNLNSANRIADRLLLLQGDLYP